MSDKELEAYILEWMNWCYTRRFYVPPGAPNILARMQPSKTGMPPNARNSADMQYFNMAVHTLADMQEYKELFACFSFLYIEQADCVKRIADKMGISRMTYYRRAKTFGRRALSMADSLKSATVAIKEQEAVEVD